MAPPATYSQSNSPPLDGVSALLEHISELRLHEIEALQQQQQRPRGSARAVGSDRDLALLLFAEEAEGLLNVSKDHGRDRRYHEDLLDRLIEMEETARYDRALALALAEGRPPPPRPPRLRKRTRGIAAGGALSTASHDGRRVHSLATAHAYGERVSQEYPEEGYGSSAPEPLHYADESADGSSGGGRSDVEGEPVGDDFEEDLVEYEVEDEPSSVMPSAEDEGSDAGSYMAEEDFGPPNEVNMGGRGAAGPSLYEGEEQHEGGYQFEAQYQEAYEAHWEDVFQEEDSSQEGDESEREDALEGEEVSGGEEMSEGGSDYEGEVPSAEDQEEYAAYEMGMDAPAAYSDDDGGDEHEEESRTASYYASDGSRGDDNVEDGYLPRERSPGTIASPVRWVSCVICGDSIPGTVIFLQCGHALDMACLREMFERAAADESLFPPQCCKRAVELQDVEQFLGRTLVDHFQDKSREFRTADRVYCHYQYCSAFLGAATLSPVALRCSACASTTCGSCKEQAHPRAACRSAGDDALLGLAKEKGWQRCIKCQYLVERMGGCPHMQCRCGAQFCYLCGRDWGKCKSTCPRGDDAYLLQEIRR